MSTTTVWELPCLSQEFQGGPRIRQEPGAQLVVSYDFESETGSYEWEEIIFTGVVGFTFTDSRHCTQEQVAAYDRLEDVSPSDWLKSLNDPSPGLRHYRIYFDDIGCYEVLATAFVPPPT